MAKKDQDMFLEDMGFAADVNEQRHQVIPIIASGDDDTIEEVQLPEVLPILTLRSSVLFPGAITPITVDNNCFFKKYAALPYFIAAS